MFKPAYTTCWTVSSPRVWYARIPEFTSDLVASGVHPFYFFYRFQNPVVVCVSTVSSFLLRAGRASVVLCVFLFVAHRTLPHPSFTCHSARVPFVVVSFGFGFRCQVPGVGWGWSPPRADVPIVSGLLGHYPNALLMQTKCILVYYCKWRVSK